MTIGLVKTRRMAAIHPPPPAATADKEAAAGEGGNAAISPEGHTSLASADVRKERRPWEVKQCPIFGKWVHADLMVRNHHLKAMF